MQFVCLPVASHGFRAPSTRGRRVVAVHAKDQKIVSFGEGLFDLIADQKGKSREEVESWTRYPGGAPFNVSCGCARLGISSTFASALGEDEDGNRLMDLVKERGVDSSCIQRVKQPTRGVYATRDVSGDREFAGFDLATTEYCDCFVESTKDMQQAVSSADILVTGTLGLAYDITGATMDAITAMARNNGVTVIIDINWRPVFWPSVEKRTDEIRKRICDYIDTANIIKISDADLEYLYGINPEEALRRPQMVAEKLPNASAVLVTGGGLGAAYCFKKEGGDIAGFVPSFLVDVVDTTGAGDAFTAGFIYRLLEEGGLEGITKDAAKVEYAIRFASAAGALTCTAGGAISAQPNLDEIEKLLGEKGIEEPK